jgi:uncharacterized membrane protein YgdD (TMEM256/DUF423 family)
MQSDQFILSPRIKYVLITGFGFVFLAVALGAFGAHVLEPYHSTLQKETYDTGIRYHFLHAFGIIICGILSTVIPKFEIKWAFWCFLGGIICFSGSLYLLSLSEVLSLPKSVLGPITPLGGLLFLAGWLLLILQTLKTNKRRHQ